METLELPGPLCVEPKLENASKQETSEQRLSGILDKFARSETAVPPYDEHHILVNPHIDTRLVAVTDARGFSSCLKIVTPDKSMGRGSERYAEISWVDTALREGGIITYKMDGPFRESSVLDILASELTPDEMERCIGAGTLATIPEKIRGIPSEKRVQKLLDLTRRLSEANPNRALTEKARASLNTSR